MFELSPAIGHCLDGYVFTFLSYGLSKGLNFITRFSVLINWFSFFKLVLTLLGGIIGWNFRYISLFSYLWLDEALPLSVPVVPSCGG
jgi:hypothetical protein